MQERKQERADEDFSAHAGVAAVGSEVDEQEYQQHRRDREGEDGPVSRKRTHLSVQHLVVLASLSGVCAWGEGGGGRGVYLVLSLFLF